MGAIPARFPVLEKLARLDRRVPRARLFPAALGALLAARKHLRPFAALVLLETLGKALPPGAAAAAPLWFAARLYAEKHAAAVRRAGIVDQGLGLGEELFRRILTSASGTLISVHEYADVWSKIRHDDGRVHLAIPELLAQVNALEAESLRDDAFPLVLTAGERRSYNANTIYRDPRWRKDDPDGALKVHPSDATALALADGSRATCESKKGSVEVRVKITDAVQPGLVTLPHGYGLEHPDPATGERRASGPALNVLTAAEDRDPISATPYHKFVRVRVRPL